MHQKPVDVLVVDVLPFKHSTRTRKIALTLKNAAPEYRIEAITLRRVGRVGFADERTDYIEDGVAVRQVQVAKPRTRSSTLSMVWNLLAVYPPGLARLAREVLTTPSPVIMIGSTSLVWLGALHQRRFGSRAFLNARERLGGINTKGSIGTLVSSMEGKMTNYMAREDVTMTAVCQGHAAEYRHAGAREVLVVRNLPRQSFASGDYELPPSTGPFRVVVVGSLYPGRGLESLIAAVVELVRLGHAIELEISGMGSDEYMDQLKGLALEVEEGGHAVRFLGSCEPEQVASRYRRGHIGTALYEPVDQANDSLSNKLFESVASGRPVLASNLPENSRTVSTEGIGWTCEVTPDGIREALLMIMATRGGFGRVWSALSYSLSGPT